MKDFISARKLSSHDQLFSVLLFFNPNVSTRNFFIAKSNPGGVSVFDKMSPILGLFSISLNATKAEEMPDLENKDTTLLTLVTEAKHKVEL